MFQFPGFPSIHYVFMYGYLDITLGRFPHSEISGSKVACTSPKLIAAYHVLHRLPAPRHSPYALSNLTFSFSKRKCNLFSSFISKISLRWPYLGLIMICSFQCAKHSKSVRWETNSQNWIVNHFLPRKEVIQPHLPIRLPCYDFTPVIEFTLGSLLLKGWITNFGCPQLPWCDGRCVQDPGTHSP